MAIDGFLKVPDIPGPSVRDGHEDEIEVHGLTFGMHTQQEDGGISRRGRTRLETVVFTKHYDKSSPYLKQALLRGTRLSPLVFAARRTVEGETSDYLVVTLTDASVVDYELQPSADAPDLLEERIGFAYRSISFRYDDEHEVELLPAR